VAAQQVLQRCELFRSFTEAGLAIFATIAVERRVPSGTPLFVEGMVGASLFVLDSGKVRLVQRAEEGERALGRAGPGDHLGALALLAPTTRLVTAVADGDCVVLELQQRDFARLQPLKPQACLKLSLAIAADLAGRAAEHGAQLRGLTAGRGGPGDRAG